MAESLVFLKRLFKIKVFFKELLIHRPEENLWIQTAIYPCISAWGSAAITRSVRCTTSPSIRGPRMEPPGPVWPQAVPSQPWWVQDPPVHRDKQTMWLERHRHGGASARRRWVSRAAFLDQNSAPALLESKGL